MNRYVKVLILVLASGWFVPVSCSTATAVLAQFEAAGSERPWAPEQRPQRFRVVAQPGEDNTSFRVLTLAELPGLKAKQVPLNFLMDQGSGRIEDSAQHARVGYRVLARTPAGQEIEVDYEDGDDQLFSRYRATASGVEPLSTRYGPISRGILMPAMFSSFILALLIYVVARIAKFALRKRLTPPPSPRP